MGGSGGDHPTAEPVSVLIDPPLWPAHGRRWSHLVSDVSLAELHAFARHLGVPERGFEGDHYDVPEERYADAVHAGAIPVSSRELLRRLQGSGLRRPKRRGERVLASAQLPDGTRVDTLESTRMPMGQVDTVILVVRREADLLVLAEGEGLSLPWTAVPAAPGDPDRDHGHGHGHSHSHSHSPALGEAELYDAMARASSSLLAELLGPVQPVLAPTQLGYLRTVRGAAGRASATVVWRWLLDGGTGAVTPSTPAFWRPVSDAATLLPAELAPLVRTA